MLEFVRSVSVARAIIVAGWFVGAAAAAPAQDAPGSTSRSMSAVVVVLSARGGAAVRSARIANALGGREVAAIYTTDAPVAYQSARTVHTAFGGSLIPYDRRSKAADDFASLLVQNAVEHATRKHPGQAILVVVEPDLMLPFLHRATGKASTSELDEAGADGFTITVPSNGDRTATRLPL